MDRSKEYVKMCGSAEEIQKLYSTEYGFSTFAQYRFKCSDNPMRFQMGIHIYESECKKRETDIWLPHQDQLQEICRNMYPSVSEKKWYFLHYYFEDAARNWCHRWNCEELNPDCYSSAEQYWLVYTMRYCYRKHWYSKKGKWEKPRRY